MRRRRSRPTTRSDRGPDAGRRGRAPTDARRRPTERRRSSTRLADAADEPVSVEPAEARRPTRQPSATGSTTRTFRDRPRRSSAPRRADAVEDPPPSRPRPTPRRRVAAGARAGVDRAASRSRPPPPPAPARTVGRFIADALRAVGVRYAFTVPGESFLGLLEGLDAAGIRVDRHPPRGRRRVHGRGPRPAHRPPGGLRRDARRRCREPRDRHPHRPPGLDADVRARRPGRAPSSAAARRSRRSTSRTRSAASPSTPRSRRSAAEVPALVGDAIRAALTGRPGPVLLSLPEDLLDEVLPEGTELDTARPAPPRPEPDDVRAVLQFLASAARPVILAGGGVLRARTSTDLAEARRAARRARSSPAGAAATSSRTTIRSTSGMTGYGSPAVVRERLESADALLVLGCRLSEITSYGYTIPAAGQRWAHVDIEPLADRAGLPAPALSVRADARAFLRAAVARLEAAVLDAEGVDARRAANAEDRAAWEAATAVDEAAWDGPGVHPGPRDRDAPPAPARRRDRHDRRRQLRAVARPLLPVPPPGHVPRPDVRGDGLRAAGRDRRGARPPRPDRGRRRRRRRLRDDDGRARDGRPREGQGRSPSSSTTSATGRSGCTRTAERGEGEGAPIATDLGPIDFAAIARAVGARGARVETRRRSSSLPSARRSPPIARPSSSSSSTDAG